MDYQELESAHLREPLPKPAHDAEPANSIYFCDLCGVNIVNPTEEDYWEFDGMLCGCHYGDIAEDENSVGDIAESIDGLAILTPYGWWTLTDEDALSLNSGLAQMINHRLTSPWDSKDSSTIITRGRRRTTEEGHF